MNILMERLIGEWRDEHQEPIKVKKHGRLAKSLFRHGLDFIRELLFFGKFSLTQFRQCLSQLAPVTPWQRLKLAVL